jgi:Pyruvate/2-oxoacid:ferredoxin oxidoreductase delta subunit
VELMGRSDVLDWQRRGLCRSLPASVADAVFFPEDATDAAARNAANRFCDLCPVNAACLTYAVENADYGIYAGTTPKQRRAMGRNRERIKCPACRMFDPLEVVGMTDCVMIVTQYCRGCGASWISSTVAVELVRDDADQAIQGLAS